MLLGELACASGSVWDRSSLHGLSDTHFICTCMCVSVDVLVCEYVCVSMCTCVCMCVSLCVCAYVCMYMCVHVCVHVPRQARVGELGGQTPLERSCSVLPICWIIAHYLIYSTCKEDRQGPCPHRAYILGAREVETCDR